MGNAGIWLFGLGQFQNDKVLLLEIEGEQVREIVRESGTVQGKMGEVNKV